MPEIQSVAFFAYPVTEISRARSFYEGVLGLKLDHNYNDAWLEYDIAGQTFAITTMAEGEKPGARGGFIALEVDDFDAWIAKIKAADISFLVEPFETPVCRMAVIADPDGNGITLHRRKNHSS